MCRSCHVSNAKAHLQAEAACGFGCVRCFRLCARARSREQHLTEEVVHCAHAHDAATCLDGDCSGIGDERDDGGSDGLDLVWRERAAGLALRLAARQPQLWVIS